MILPCKNLIERLLRKAYDPFVESTAAAHLEAPFASGVPIAPGEHDTLRTPEGPLASFQTQPEATADVSLSGSSRLARWNHSDWRLVAACAHMDTLIFFPIGEGTAVAQQVGLAKAICASCPAQSQCLEFAIATIQNDGIWGGTTEDERRLIKRARRAAARRSATKAA